MKALLQPEKLFRFAMWGIALLFAWFLLGFGGLILRDLPLVSHEIDPEQFASPQLRALQQTSKRIEAEQQLMRDQRELYQQTLNTQQTQYDNAHSSFQNWLATRNATQNAAQDTELVERTKKLEQLKTVQASIQQKIATFDQHIIQLNQQQTQLTSQLATQQENANQQYQRAVFRQELTIFGYRLLFILPLLLMASWLFLRQRHNKYWPFVWGFIFFTLYSFFVELIPYLPSYGGYIRYAVGLVLVLVGGYYGISWMQCYLAQRQLKAQATETERRQQLDRIHAIKKLSAHVCPSCERQLVDQQTHAHNFCMFCGLQLYHHCPICQTRHNSFFEFCPNCGTSNRET